MRFLAVSVATIALLGDAHAEPVERARVHVVDGDSVTLDGVEWRLKGFDAAEINSAKCEAERRLGIIAKRRLMELLAAAKVIDLSTDGATDRYRRPLGDLVIDGVNVRETLISEGLARPYNGGYRKGWCSRDSRDDLVPGPPPAAPKITTK